jgi:uncharacterized protein YgiM (DUF1202 family)
LEKTMETNLRKWSSMLYVLCLAMVMTMMPITTDAAETRDLVVTTSTKKQQDTSIEQLNAGAAVLVDVNVAMNDAELTTLVRKQTSDIAPIHAMDEKDTESTLVMAKVNQYVNIRKEPNQDSEKVGVLYKDCGGDILQRQDSWTKIQSGDVTGWVSDDYLYFGEEAQKEAKEVGILTAYSETETLRVRKEASLDSGVLGLLAMGEAVEAIEEDGDWVSINYEGETGYVAAEYVKVEFDLDTAESVEAIQAREAAEKEAARAQAAAEREATRKQQKEAVLTSASELNILAALVQCEAGGESYEGQLAVASVVMNRVRCGAYPNTITDVIYASGQFSPANSTKMSNLALSGNIKASCLQAAQEAINGNCNIGDALHFRRAGNKDGIIIGNHVFW